MSLHILHVTTPNQSSPYLSGLAANNAWLPEALRARGHEVTVRVAGNAADAALAARHEGFDVIHIHSEDTPARSFPQPGTPVVETRYGTQAGPGATWIALSSKDAGVEDMPPAAVITPAFNTAAAPATREHGDELVAVLSGRDGYALSAAIAVARHTERPLTLLLPEGATLTAESRREIERAAKFVRIAEVGVEWSPGPFQDAACYLAFERSIFDMGALTALAAGLPVVTFDGFPACELIVHGESGYAVRSVEDACRAVESLGLLDSSLARSRAQVLFDADTAAMLHEQLYEQLVRGDRPVFHHPESGPRDRRDSDSAGESRELSGVAA